MREIRFRVWDNKINAYQQMAAMMNVHTGEISNLPDRFIIEQFTGLLDKNGKMIFEGDIITHGDNFPSLVYWDAEQAGFMLIEKKPKYKRGYSGYPRTHEMNYMTFKPEVIGTIHDAEYKELAK